MKNIRYSIPLFLLLIKISCFSLLQAQPTFEDRRTWLLDQVRSTDVFSGEGKTAMPVACAHLYENNADADAIQRVSISADVNDRFFRMLGQVRAYYYGKANFSPEQLKSLKDILTSDDNWNNTGTENHRLMVWTSGYLFAQAFPDEEWNWTEGNVPSKLTSTQLMEKTLELMITRGQWRYSGGNSEYLSPNYDTFSVAAMCNLYDFADDPNARAVAEGFLNYHVGSMALAVHDGYITAPNSRYAEQGQKADLSISQWIPWIYWGQNAPSTLGAGDRYVIYLALSSWRPDPILDAIAKKEVEMPFTWRSQQSQFQRSPLRYVVRTTYRDLLYTVSSGVIRHVPSAFILDDSHFSIAWTTSDEKRFIEAMHPYWRTKSQGNDYWRGPTSPFQQSIQQENTAILIYDIPETDPWAGIGQWAGERNATLTQRAQVRIPMAAFPRIQGENDWYFFREGSVYIGIKALQAGSTWEQFFFPPGDNFSWVIIRSDAARTGFIFEVGDEAEFGSFEAFQAQLQSNPISIDWQDFIVTYTNSRGDELKIQYNTSLDTPNGSIPTSWINSRMIDHEGWPFIESQNLNLTDQVMTLAQDGKWLSIDWRNDIPVFIEGTGNPAPRIKVRYTGVGTVNEAFSYALETLYEPVSFTATGLPDGLSIDSTTGMITGTPTESGTFKARIEATNSTGSTGEAVTLLINGPPQITTISEDGMIYEGHSATFMVTASSITPLTYQWFFNSTEIEGATAATFTIDTATLDDSGEYAVEVSNAYGSVSSLTVTLTVNPSNPFVELLPTAVDQGDDWYLVDPIGLIRNVDFPLVEHQQHGFWWLAGDGNDGLFIFDFELSAWLYTSIAIYPDLYLFDSSNSSFIRYIEAAWNAGIDNRWFYEYGTDARGFFISTRD